MLFLSHLSQYDRTELYSEFPVPSLTLLDLRRSRAILDIRSALLAFRESSSVFWRSRTGSYQGIRPSLRLIPEVNFYSIENNT